MANYTKTTDFLIKDTAPTGSSSKVVRGSEFDVEFNNLQTVSATKADLIDPTFSGTVTTSNLTVLGNTALGNSSTDTVTVFTDLLPSADGTHDLGASGAKWQDLHINGTATLANINNTGSLLVTGTATMDSLTVGGSLQAADAILTGTTTAANVVVTGTTTIGTVDINGGTIDNAVIGATTPAAGTFSTASTTGNFTVGGVLETTSEIDANGGIKLEDNVKAKFGDNSDLQIYHDGSASRIGDTGTGDLIIQGTNLRLSDTATGQTFLQGASAGAVTAYYAGATKLATTNGGIDVTGTATMDGLSVTGTLGNWSIDPNGSIQTFTRASANYIKASSAGGYLVFQTGGAIERLKVNDDGIDVTGVAQMDGLTINRSGVQSRGIEWNRTGTIDAAIILDETEWLHYDNYFNNGHRFRTGAAGAENNRATIAPNGDVSFYNGGGTDVKFFWDASAESLGIGTSAPDNKLAVIETGAASPTALITSGNYAAMFGSNTTSAAGVTQGIMLSGGGSNVRGVALLAEVQSTGNNTDFIIATSNAGATPTEKMRVLDTGLVGIGTDTPTVPFHVNGATFNLLGLFESTDASAKIGFKDSTTTNDYSVAIGAEGDDMIFASGAGGATAMRLDSSGNLLLGTDTINVYNGTDVGVACTKTGYVFAGKSSAAPLWLNRITNDGDIANFSRDGTVIGSVGTRANYITIGTGDTNLLFNSAANAITPEGDGASSTGIIDLGRDTSKFQDLYLSGGVYLGGIAAANKLDDYEEGTWTPTVIGGTSGSATLTIQAATYTKVGNVVNAYCYITAIALNTGNVVGQLQIDGLPFTIADNNLQNAAITYQTVSATVPSLSGRITATSLRVMKNSSNLALTDADLVTNDVGIMMIGVTYNTNA